MNNTDTTVYLNKSDAEKFKQFLENYAMFSIFLERGIFKNKSGDKSASITFNFDHTGTLQTIHRGDVVFSRKFDLIILP